jgi:hypothetical protein
MRLAQGRGAPEDRVRGLTTFGRFLFFVLALVLIGVLALVYARLLGL